jgi:hypothetical protein
VDKFVALQQKLRAISESTGFRNRFGRLPNCGESSARLPTGGRRRRPILAWMPRPLFE